MIQTRRDLHEYLRADRQVQQPRGFLRAALFDQPYRVKTALRKCEYHFNNRNQSFVHMFLYAAGYTRYLWLLRKTGSEIPLNVFGKGLVIWHMQGIIVNSEAKVGEYCSLSARCVIGQAHGRSPKIGDHVELMLNATVLGGISIADDVRVGANALVLKNIEEPGTTWGGYQQG